LPAFSLSSDVFFAFLLVVFALFVYSQHRQSKIARKNVRDDVFDECFLRHRISPFVVVRWEIVRITKKKEKKDCK